MFHKTISLRTAFPALIIAMAVFAIGTVATPRPARAATTDCGVTAGDIAQITAIKNDPTLSPTDEIKAELAVRKTLVGETIGCAQQEVQMLQAQLASTTVAGSDTQLLQAQLQGRLNEAAEFYNAELAKLDVVGIAGTEDVAQEVLAWRQNTFVPLGENVDSFMLWAGNQNLFSTAETRMAQTERAVSFIEAASPNPGLQTALTSAQSSFATAENDNTQAKTALTENLSPDQPLALIKGSLDALSSTYQGFFTISGLINNILPQ
ncbi:MAG TPA: hypothetical protein VMA75_04640 [Candidatus Paceibacterota bacterium]|nr:hypothetical protein [Candidatus Paceibacterota bacterium]